MKWQRHAQGPIRKRGINFLIADLTGYPVALFTKRKTKILTSLAFYYDLKNKIASEYTLEKDEASGSFGYNFYLNKKKFEKFLKEMRQIFKEADIFKREIDKIDFNNISTKTIFWFFKDTSLYYRARRLTWMVTLPPYIWKIEKSLKEGLSKFVPEKDFNTVLEILTLSERRYCLESERYQWLKNISLPAITQCSQFQNAKKNTKILKNIENHLKKYKYYPAGFERDSMTSKDYLNILKNDFETSKKLLKKEFLNIKNKEKIVRAKKQKIITKYKISRDLVKKAKIIGQFGVIGLELRVLGWQIYTYLWRKLLGICAKRAKVSPEVLGNLAYKEFLKFLKQNLKLDAQLKQRLKERKNKNILMLITPEKGYQVFWGKSADKKFYSEIEISGEVKEVSEFNGEIACSKGIVSGKVFLFRWDAPDYKKRIYQFPKDYILVSSETRPLLMPAIRKAKAIVTDEGGITCHAAIVSRELGIPCIIGTKIATKVLKDGDLVEVDTNRGVVKIIKK